ncbi:MAG: hypothetical protein ACRDRK_01330 [Pseudonocardia sp.]
MSRSVNATLYRVFGREQSELLDTVLAGEVIADRDTAERLIRTAGRPGAPTCKASPRRARPVLLVSTAAHPVAVASVTVLGARGAEFLPAPPGLRPDRRHRA